MAKSKTNVRKRVWEIVEVARPGDRASGIFDVFILSLIFLNVVAVIVDSVQSIQARYGSLLYVFEIVSIIVFTIEYLARLWSCTVDTRFHGAIGGRIRFASKGMPLIDLLAILPFYLPFLGIDLRSIRILRLFRIFRVAKIGRYYSSLNLIKQVFQTKNEELVLTSVLMGFLLVVSSTILYYCENPSQPDIFSSIPASLWWAVATLTSVGYGDIYPVTVLGKLFASLIAIIGIGMFALPTGILGAGFVEEIQKSKKITKTCPHCGKTID